MPAFSVLANLFPAVMRWASYPPCSISHNILEQLATYVPREVETGETEPMARRESQGLQITLIVFVMLTIILAVTTIAFWNKSKGLTEENASLTSANQQATSERNQAVEEAQRLKTWIGHEPQASIETIEQEFNADMASYGRSAPTKTYRGLPVALFQALQERNKQALTLREQMRQAEAEFDQSKQQLQTALAAAEQAKAEAEAALLQTRDDFAQQRSEINAQKDQLAAEVQSLRQQVDQLQATTTAQIRDLQNELQNKDAIIGQRDDQLKELQDESFEVPDGKILFAHPRTGRVMINLGSADGLRRQVTFSVYGVDVNNVAREEKKGTIEVIRIIGPHSAEARVTSDDFADPILSGDVIYTPLWNSRTALRFAIVGKIDLNEDGRDDRQVIKNLIRLNGGKVDAEDQDGKVVGQLTPQTRYLVLGAEPGDSDAGDAAALRSVWSDMINQADRFGVEQLSVQELLDFVGYDGEKRTLPLGDRAKSDDFVPRPGAAAGQGSYFRDRGPSGFTGD